MKPFNLEAAKAGKPVVTRDGRPARYLGDITTMFDDPYVFVIQCRDEAHGEFIERVTAEGKPRNWDSPEDLFMAPEKKEYWVNVYKDVDGSVGVGSGVFSSRDSALESALPGFNKYYVGAVKIWEEEV